MVPLLIPLHGLGGRQDLPLPFSVVLTAAAAAVVVSFLVLTWRWPTARYAGTSGIPLPRVTRLIDHPALRWTVRAAGFAATAWAVLALLFGPDRLTNPFFGFLYVWVWIGLVPVALLFGPVWRTLNPFRTMHLLLARVANWPAGRGLWRRLPASVGLWPGVLLVLSFVWLELVAPDRTTISVVLLWVAVYAVVMIVGGILFGASWYAAADPFEVYATIMAKLSIWARRADGVVVIRTPLENLSTLQPQAGLVGFVVVLLGSTAFDGLSNSTDWIRWIQDSTVPGVVLASLGLVGMIGIVAGSYLLAVYLSGRLSGTAAAGAPGTFIHSLVPIALGYVIAHYLTLAVFEGQRTLILWSDPLGIGWNAFGTAGWQISLSFFAYTGLIAVLQAGAVVFGHILGIVAAHDRALSVAPADKAVTSQVPMLVVMIGYTLGGLWLLFSS